MAGDCSCQYNEVSIRKDNSERRNIWVTCIASGTNNSDDSIERMQPSMLIEVILNGVSIHASSSPEMEYFERNTI